MIDSSVSLTLSPAGWTAAEAGLVTASGIRGSWGLGRLVVLATSSPGMGTVSTDEGPVNQMSTCREGA